MNRIYRSICNLRTGTFIAVSENARSAGKKSSLGNTMSTSGAHFALKTLAASLLVACGSSLVYAQPVGGEVAAGTANISSVSGNMTINQTSPNVAINWQSFNINSGESVNFVQPNSSSVALNRVLGSDPSRIMGSLSANGKVFLVNPNGVLFGKTASVNVGGLVASTLNITDADFMANADSMAKTKNYKFSGTGTGTVVNQGAINADGGFVALLGAKVSNQGVIAAKLGTVALAAGKEITLKEITLDVAGDKLLNVVVNQDVVDALVENGGIIRADGGQVLMTSQTAGGLLANAVNNTGVIQAQTIQNVKGTIKLLAGMQNGSSLVTGTIDASAPTGGDGGFIETSAAKVRISDTANITTLALAPSGQTGTWLIGQQDFNVGIDPTKDDISGATLSGLLVTNSVTISTLPGSDAIEAGTPPETNLNTEIAGSGDININEAVSWTASASPTTLKLLAGGDVNINQAVTATNGNFEVCCGRDINVDAPITTVNGSVSLAAGRDINMNAAITTTDGNITFCADEDIYINEKITLTRGTIIPNQSLGLPLGLVLSAGYGATKPGSEGGTVNFAPLAPPITVTGPNAPVTINYNPVSYTAPTDYAENFTLTEGATLTQRMLVYATGGNKIADGSAATTLSGLIGNPLDVSLVANQNSTATFDNAAVGTNKTITFAGYSLAGDNEGDFALAADCCSNVLTTTGTISAQPVPPINPPVDEKPEILPEDEKPETPPEDVTPEIPPVDVTPKIPPVDVTPEIPPVIVLPVIQPTPPGKLPPIFVAPPLLTVLPPAEFPTLEVYVPPVEVYVPPVVVVPPKPVVIPQPPVIYVPPVYPPKQDRN